MTVVVDTNVVLVANRQHKAVSETCVATCAQRLQQVMQSGRIAIDDGFRILKEYQSKLPTSGQPGPGTKFVKWALQNHGNSARCDQVAISEDPSKTFAEFPSDPDLAKFDPSDRKFVAVAIAHPDTPTILQASDSKWVDWAPFLENHGVSVEMLCESDIEKFAQAKKKR